MNKNEQNHMDALQSISGAIDQMSYKNEFGRKAAIKRLRQAATKLSKVSWRVPKIYRAK